MSKHTPAPWSTPHMARDEISCNCAYVLAEPYMGSICTISVSDGKSISELGNDCPPLEEAQANARLIAAAPDLLAALQKVMALNSPFTGNPSHADLVEFWQDEKEQGRGAADDMLAALAAIDKATRSG